jgi:hypothetical protein
MDQSEDAGRRLARLSVRLGACWSPLVSEFDSMHFTSAHVSICECVLTPKTSYPKADATKSAAQVPVATARNIWRVVTRGIIFVVDNRYYYGTDL